MNRTLTYHIDDSIINNTCNHLTIGAFLKQQGFSHPLMVHLKKTPESILLNSIWSYVNTKLSIGDVLEVHIIEEQSSENIPPTEISSEAFRQMIVYEDEDILLVNKPASLPVHPSMGHHEDTLANYCAYYYKYLCSSSITGGFVFRCVNRLDRDTSGLVLIAKNMLSSAVLSGQQLNRQIHRTYQAVVTGITPEEGTIDLPIARKEGSVIERCIDYEKGEKAITHYKRIAYTNDYSLLEIHLETGRTHQIRVHMKAIGHPLPGDFLYYPDFTHIQRQALHSYRLEFFHPVTGDAMSFTQEIPEDFKAFRFN